MRVGYCTQYFTCYQLNYACITKYRVTLHQSLPDCGTAEHFLGERIKHALEKERWRDHVTSPLQRAEAQHTVRKASVLVLCPGDRL